MTIGVDATALYGRYGGVEYALWNLLDALRARTASSPLSAATPRFVVWIPRDGPPPRLLQRFGPNWNWVRLSFEGAHKLRRIAWQQLQLPLALRRFGCDVLHAPTYVCPLLAPTPVVLTVYDLIALSQPRFATRANRLHYRALLPLSVRRAAQVIVPSQSVRDEILSRGWKQSSNLHVIAPGVEPVFRQLHREPDVQRIREKFGLPPNYLLWAGNFEPKKNGAVLRRALELLPRFGIAETPVLALAGGARAWESHDFAAAGGIVQLGYVQRDELPLLLAGCRVFVFPSLAEGFGMPALEALAAGTPLVASTRVPLPGLENVALLCDPRDPAALAQNIARVLLSPDLAAELRTKGRAYANAFTWERAALETFKVYEEAVSF